jgi:hypothetical protein
MSPSRSIRGGQATTEVHTGLVVDFDLTRGKPGNGKPHVILSTRSARREEAAFEDGQWHLYI